VVDTGGLDARWCPIVAVEVDGLHRADGAVRTVVDLVTARAAKAELRARLAHEDGICGVGLARGAGGYEVRVTVTHDGARDRVPAAIGGVPVRVRVSGPLRARGAAAAPGTAHRARRPGE
jgi:hypothetical protein